MFGKFGKREEGIAELELEEEATGILNPRWRAENSSGLRSENWLRPSVHERFLALCSWMAS